MAASELTASTRPSPKPAQLVDKSRGEKLVVNMNITFPRVPCYLLSVDIMDISGEHQNGGHGSARCEV
jgi:hypothetical protein